MQQQTQPKSERANGAFATVREYTKNLFENVIAKEGVTDDRLAMARLDFVSSRVEAVHVRGSVEPNTSRIRCTTDDPEIASFVPVGTMLQFFEAATPRILGNRPQLLLTLDAFARMKDPHGAKTRGIYLASSAGRMLHEQYVRIDRTKVKTVEGLSSVRYDDRARQLYAIRIGEGHRGAELVTTSADTRLSLMLDGSTWTTIAQFTNDGAVSLSRPRIVDGKIEFIANLQIDACQRLVINQNTQSVASMSEIIPSTHIVLATVPGKKGLIVSYMPYKGEIEFSFSNPDPKNPLSAYAS